MHLKTVQSATGAFEKLTVNLNLRWSLYQLKYFEVLVVTNFLQKHE